MLFATQPKLRNLCLHVLRQFHRLQLCVGSGNQRAVMRVCRVCHVVSCVMLCHVVWRVCSCGGGGVCVHVCSCGGGLCSC